MIKFAALDLAIRVSHNPPIAVQLRDVDFPEDVIVLLRIMAGLETAFDSACRRTDLDGSQLESAARFYIEQVAMHPTADDYRLFCTTSDAPLAKLREHRNLILKWLHPDHNSRIDDHAKFVRICDAWSRISHNKANDPLLPEFLLDRSRDCKTSRILLRRATGQLLNPFSSKMERQRQGRQRRNKRLLELIVTATAVIITIQLLDKVVTEQACPPGWARWLPICFDPNSR